jgi:hypothetical protein
MYKENPPNSAGGDSGFNPGQPGADNSKEERKDDIVDAEYTEVNNEEDK